MKKIDLIKKMEVKATHDENKELIRLLEELIRDTRETFVDRIEALKLYDEVMFLTYQDKTDNPGTIDQLIKLELPTTVEELDEFLESQDVELKRAVGIEEKIPMLDKKGLTPERKEMSLFVSSDFKTSEDSIVPLKTNDSKSWCMLHKDNEKACHELSSIGNKDKEVGESGMFSHDAILQMHADRVMWLTEIIKDAYPIIHESYENRAFLWDQRREAIEKLEKEMKEVLQID